MDKRAAAQYMSKLFGTGQGFVAVAYKDKKDRWEERTFAYPAEKAKVVAWATENADSNIFICPALRTTPARVKADGTNLRWLWADVDWDKVPENKRDEVNQIIRSMDAMEVLSGTGPNMHVYVPLDREVSVDEHYRLNTGLRDLLYADAKHADNSLLRLPGTTNWKTMVGSPVQRVREAQTKWSPERLTSEHKAFADVAVTDTASGGSAWTSVDVGDLPRRIQRMANMPTDQAVAKYGSRHKAVWAITGELYKRGLSDDQIHTLMDNFPSAVDKNDDEHNGYDVHKDVVRRLVVCHASDNAGLTEDEQEAVEDEAFEMADDATDDDNFAADVEKLAQQELLRSAARKRARDIEAERGWIAPPASVSRSLSDALTAPADPEPYLIDGLAPARGNMVLTAGYKVGKTDFMLASLARSLADGVPFLDHFAVTVPEGGYKVGHWNLEMDETHLIDGYVRPSEYENTDNLVIASLRGYRVSLLSTVGRAWTVRWLIDNQVKVWTIDSIAQLARMAGVSENANEEMGQLLGAVDEIKVEAGVQAAFLIAHTGRAEQEVGKERARAATIIDDWPDARWVMTKDTSDVRSLQVEGRGTSLKATTLDYDIDSHRYTFGGLTRTEAAADGWIQTVVRILNSMADGLTESTLIKKMQETGKIGRDRAKDIIAEAEAANWIEIRTVASSRGGRAAKMHYLTGNRVEGDRRMGATAREVNMAKDAGSRKRRVPK